MEWKDVKPSGRFDHRVAAIGPQSESELFSQMFEAAGQAMGLSLEVLRVEVEHSEFDASLKHLGASGVHFVSVSGPFKVDAARAAERFFESHQAFGVANTLQVNGGIWAQNTEVAGVMKVVKDLCPGTALVLGTGHGARSVVGALLQMSWSVRLWNRNALRSRPLKMMMARYGEVELVSSPDPAGCRLIVNATSLGAKPGEQPPVVWTHGARDTVALDLVYRRVATEFLRQAANRGFHTIDGRALLAEQAALSMEWWLEREVPREPMRRLLGLAR